jgi:hypothetical protein
MKYLSVAITVIFVIIIIAAISKVGNKSVNDSLTSSQKAESTVISEQTISNSKLLTKDEFEQMYSNPDNFTGRTVEFYAKIFIEPEKDDKGIYMQAHANDDLNKNTLIGYPDNKVDLKRNDVIHVWGVVLKKVTGQNAFGAEVNAPMIRATKIEKADYATAFVPAIKTIQVNQEQNQYGYILKIGKVEIADKETRVYVNIQNHSQNKISFYSFNTKMVQGNRQLKEQSNYEENYPKIDSELLPDIVADGVLTFEPVNLDGGNIKIVLEGSSDNYENTFKPFVFDVPLK